MLERLQSCLPNGPSKDSAIMIQLAECRCMAYQRNHNSGHRLSWSVPPPGSAWWVPTTGLPSASLLRVQVLPVSCLFPSVCRSFFMPLYVFVVLRAARRSDLARRPFNLGGAAFTVSGIFCASRAFWFRAYGLLKFPIFAVFP